MINVSIIEDDKVILTNLVRYLSRQDDIKVGVIADSIENFFNKIKSPGIKFSNEGILLLDIGLPGISGLEAIPLLLRENPNLNIIMLTTFEEEKIILKAMCSGAVAYISKRTPLKKIVEAILIVNDGGSYMSPMIARDIFNYMVKSNAPKKKSSFLTGRQLEILKMIVEGKSYRNIAAELFISPETVRSHIKNIYKSLHVNNKAEAIGKYLNGEV
ncbi:response regulator transcription factor [Portibacter lacus]|uniref:DNA-binding response regulator n=1 Tax=Portibacter lacus TaxID=1099794 RepID=A0AA37SXG7_9BACT|nr:response regulator transcription factor [Portibacter lacus]GLR19563.1 DNA-binding response regulator [Portibacter lacus]